MLLPRDTDAAPVVVLLVMLTSGSTDVFSTVVDVVVWQAETLTSRPLSQVSTSMDQCNIGSPVQFFAGSNLLLITRPSMHSDCMLPG